MLDTEVLARASPRPLDVATPLGTVRFAVRVSGWDVPARPEFTWDVPSGARLLRWRHPSVRLDVLSGRTVPRLPEVRCHSTVFRVLAREPLSEFAVQAELTGMPADAYRGVDTGERLDAVTIETADAVVSVGGPDVELLRSCARLGHHVPPYWAGQLPDNAVEIEAPARLIWQLPPVERGDYAELWVSVAWGEPGGPGGQPATRLAVDVDPARVLRELTH